MAIATYELGRVGERFAKFKTHPIKLGVVERQSPEPSLHKFLRDQFKNAFHMSEDEMVIIDSESTFPASTKVAMHIVDNLETEYRPKKLLGKTAVPRDHKRAISVCIVDKLPPDIVGEEGLEYFAKKNLARNATQYGMIVEGNPNDLSLKEGARAAISSMEGNVGIIAYTRDGQEFFKDVADRLRQLGGVTMVNKKEKEEVKITGDGIVDNLKRIIERPIVVGSGLLHRVARRIHPHAQLELSSTPAPFINGKESTVELLPTFKNWCDRREVQEIGAASRLLARHNLLWKLNLRKLASKLQLHAIFLQLKTTGLSEGNLSALVRNFADRGLVMAITETGVPEKDNIVPEKGHVTAVQAINKFGTTHLILKGFPQGHPVNLFTHPSGATIKDVGKFFIDTYRRGNFKRTLKDLTHLNAYVDHPPSIEANENGRFYMFSAMYEAGQVRDVEEYNQYMESKFNKSARVSIIPEGLKPGPDCAIHVHAAPTDVQRYPDVKIVPLEIGQRVMRELGLKHTPSCGSEEAAQLLLILTQISYEMYGMPQSDEEIRGTHLPGHGVFLWGRKGMKHLSESVVKKVSFMDRVPRF